MHRSHTTRRLAALAIAPVLAFSVGCGKAADKIGEKAAEKAIENAAGGDVDIDSDGNVKIETDEGTYEADGEGNIRIETEDGVVTSGAGVPDGWPEDVPIPDSATVGYGSSAAGQMTVTLESEASVADLYDEIKGGLDGWTVEDEYSMDSTSGAIRSARFLDGDRSVSVSVTESGDGRTAAVLTYSVESA